MGVIVNHNISALNAANNLNQTYSRLARSVSRLSSGLRITSARDDAAGLAIRELMRSDIRVMGQGVRNAQDAINMLQTADGAMGVIDEKLIRMKELAEQAATGTYTTQQREIMDQEFQAMAAEITRIAKATEFNGIKLLDGSTSAIHNGNGIKIHFGTGNDSAEDYYYANLGDVTWESLQGYGEVNGLMTNHTFGAATNAVQTSGHYAFYYNNDGDSSGTEVADIFAINAVASANNLNDVASAINQGTAARGVLRFSTGVASNALITIGGSQFQFVNSGAATVTGATAVSMGTASATAASAMSVLVAALNGTGHDVWAIQSSGDTTVATLFARTAGTTGNSIAFAADRDLGTWTAGGTATALAVAATNARDAGADSYTGGTDTIGSAGQFAFYYDRGSTGAATDLSDLFGIITTSAGTTLNNIASAINAGIAARVTFSVGGNLTAGEVISIGNQTFQVVSAGSAAAAGYLTLEAGATSQMTAASALNQIVSNLNATATADTWALQSAAGEALVIYARTTGAGGNSLRVSGGAGADVTVSGASGGYLASGGDKTWVSASVIAASLGGHYNASGYKLRIDATSSYRMSFGDMDAGRFFAMTSLAHFNAAADWTNGSTLAASSVLAGGGSAWLTASVVAASATNDNQTGSGYLLRIIGANSTYDATTSYGITAATMGAGTFAAFTAPSFFDDDDSGDSYSSNWATAAVKRTNTSILTQSSAQQALDVLDDAIVHKDTSRAEAGSKANRLQNTVTALTIQAENLQASEAAISDADVAAEMSEFTRNLILAQSGVAMLAQANSLSNLALSLLG